VRGRRIRAAGSTVMHTMSVRTRVIAAAALLVVLTSVVTGVLGTTLLRSYLLDRSDVQLRAFARAAEHILARPRPNRGPGLPTQFVVEIVTPDGNARTAGALAHSGGAPSLSAAQISQTGTPFTAGSWRVIVEPLPGGSHAVISYSLDDLNSTVARLEVADAIAGAVAVALLALVGVPLMRVSLAPLAGIEATAAAIAAGDLSRRIDHPSARTEVGRLAQALNTMLGTIEAAYQARANGEARALHSEDKMRRFAADASHELRTPLTSVRGVAEFGLQLGDSASRDDLLDLMRLVAQEAGRMSRLVDDLLLLARFDAGRPLRRRPVDLASIAAEAVHSARLVHPGRTIALDAAEPVVVYADDERVRQVIDNLIANAVQHTPGDSPVTVTVADDRGTGLLTVADTGPGLAPEQASQVFERFYRTDEARTRATGGTGLGLAIAASLTAAHDGQITVDTEPGRGAAFTIRLPPATRASCPPPTGLCT
jgi:signal transduction histidine kinase